jgi:hypothetical protein
MQAEQAGVSDKSHTNTFHVTSRERIRPFNSLKFNCVSSEQAQQHNAYVDSGWLRKVLTTFIKI